MSAKAVALEIAHLPARKNVQVRAGRRVRVDVQADAQTDAAVQFVEVAVPLAVKTDVGTPARQLVAVDVPINVQVLVQVDAIMNVREPARVIAQGLVLRFAMVRAELAAPEQWLCFREPV